MKIPAAVVTALLTLALAGDAPARRDVPAFAVGVVEGVLAVADEVVPRARFDEVLGATPVPTLQAIANDPGLDVGVRLRAVRALGFYRLPESREALHGVISARGGCDGDGVAVTGTPLLFVRAVLESLGAIGDPDDVGRITPCLQAKSRDLRVAAARALRDLGASTAVCPLQHQRDVETVPQVQSAISEALRRWPAQICSRPPVRPNVAAE